MNDLMRFNCPACGKSLKVKPAMAGKRGRCPSAACGHSFRIPSQSPGEGERPRWTHRYWIAGGSACLMIGLGAWFWAGAGDRSADRPQQSNEAVAAAPDAPPPANGNAKPTKAPSELPASDQTDAELETDARIQRIAERLREGGAASQARRPVDGQQERGRTPNATEPPSRKTERSQERREPNPGAERPANMSPTTLAERRAVAERGPAVGVHVYTVPRAKRFGTFDIRSRPFQQPEMRPVPVEGGLPLHLVKETPQATVPGALFWVEIPESLASKPETEVEIEPVPLARWGGVDGLRDFDQATRLLQEGGKIAVTGLQTKYNLSLRNAPKHVYLLYLPKQADRKTLDALYPKEKIFEFQEEKARKILTESALQASDVELYLDLLHRGGAVIVPKKEGAKTYLTVQPGRELLEIPI